MTSISAVPPVDELQAELEAACEEACALFEEQRAAYVAKLAAHMDLENARLAYQEAQDTYRLVKAKAILAQNKAIHLHNIRKQQMKYTKKGNRLPVSPEAPAKAG